MKYKVKKGQHVIISEMFLFSLGAVIVILLYSILNYSVEASQAAYEKEEYLALADYVQNILYKFEICRKYSFSCSYRVMLPSKLADERYWIELKGRNITIGRLSGAGGRYIPKTERKSLYKNVSIGIIKLKLDTQANLSGVGLSTWREVVLEYINSENKVILRK